MKASTRLHELIHALQPEERKHYVQAAKQRKKKGRHLYLELFEAIAAQSSYDETALKHRFEGTSFGKSLAFPKTHLYRQVLHSLQEFHRGKSRPSQFRSDMEQIELLVERQLPEQALRIIHKGLERAEIHENARQVLRFLAWQRRVVLQMQEKSYAGRIAEISAAEQYWEGGFLAEQAATRLHDRLYTAVQAIRRKAQAIHNPEIQAYGKQLDQLFQREFLPFPARIAALRARAHFHHLREDFHAVHDTYRDEIATWEAQPHQIEAQPLRFARAFSQWLNSKALIQDYEALFKEIERLRARELDLRGRAQVFQATFNLELFYHINIGQAADAVPKVPAIEQGLMEFDAFLLPSAKMGFYYNLALVFWMAGQAAPALRWVNHILQFDAGEIRKDIQLIAPLLEKILHFELGHTSLLESWFRSFQYRRRQQKATDRLEQMLLEVLRQALRLPSPSEQKPLFEQLAQDLEHYAQEPNVSRVGLEELRIWAQRQLKR